MTTEGGHEAEIQMRVSEPTFSYPGFALAAERSVGRHPGETAAVQGRHVAVKAPRLEAALQLYLQPVGWSMPGCLQRVDDEEQGEGGG